MHGGTYFRKTDNSVGNLVDQYSDERHTRDGSTEPGDSAAGEAEISLINEAVTAVWSDFGVKADEKGKPRSPERPKCRERMQATKSQRRMVIFTSPPEFRKREWGISFKVMSLRQLN